MAKSNPGQAVNWDRSEAITVPDKTRDRKVRMRVADWKRIKNCLNDVKLPFPWIPKVYSAAFSIGFAFGIATLSLLLSGSTLKPWIWVTGVCLTIFPSIVGWIFYKLHSQNHKTENTSIASIIKDMEEVESLFPDGTFSQEVADY